MAPVELLDVRPGDKVLDLCAAPGGKTTQIAAKLVGRGLLVTNDNQPDRVKALAKNVELYGVTNAVVLNETPERLAPVFPRFFDKILVDAPCSGEGMFRKDEAMAKSWDENAPDRYAAMQRPILARAADMLAPGGRLVYSTCTFSPKENEEVIASFLAERPEFRVVPIPPIDGFEPGRPDWIEGGCRDESCETVSGTVRLWPHRLRGEGHYAAVLERIGGSSEAERTTPAGASDLVGADRSGRELKRLKRDSFSGARSSGKPKEAGGGTVSGAGLFETFAAGHLTGEWAGTYRLQGDFVYRIPDGVPELNGLKVVRPGWFVGSVRDGRFTPSHPLAMGLKRDSDAVRSVSFAAGDPDAIRYLKGETLRLPEERLKRSGTDVPAKGYCLIAVDGYPLGWGKWLDGMLKNEYPPGWRWT